MRSAAIIRALKGTGAKNVTSRSDGYLEGVTWYYVETPHIRAGAVERHIFNNYSHYIVYEGNWDGITIVRFAAFDNV